jgi:hypothetical protein
MYELCIRLRIGRRHHLSTSHLRVVLPLENQAQARLLAEAESHRWPVRRLEEEVAAVSPHERNRRRGGRKRRSRLRTTIHALAACLQEAGDLASADEEDSPESTRALLEILDRVKGMCTLLEGRVAKRVPGAKTDPPPEPE